MLNRLAALVLLTAPLSAGVEAAAASDRYEGEGVSLHLLAERPGADGRFRAALLVDLKPGWKTYWLDPGEAGIPPTLAFDAASEMTASFPPPHRFDDGFAKSIVYSEPFAVALEGKAVPGTARPAVKATLGVCQEICVPISADLVAEFASTGETRRAVDAAFAALPRESSVDTGIVGANLSRDARTLTVTVRPASAAVEADLFAASSGGWTFGPPGTVETAGGDARIALPVVAKPRKAPVAPLAIDAILSGPGGAWRARGLPVGTDP